MVLSCIELSRSSEAGAISRLIGSIRTTQSQGIMRDGIDESDDLAISYSSSLPKPNPALFNSAGKLSKKHDSMHERLSLPILNNTPGTPKSSRSKFVLPSSLSPFALSPKVTKNATKQSGTISHHMASTPLRLGFSSEQLIFDLDLNEKQTNSPSRMLFERSFSPMSSQMQDYDVFDIDDGPSSEFDNGLQDYDTCHGSCDITPDMLKPVVWKNPSAHMLTLEYFRDNFDHSCDNEWIAEYQEPLDNQDFFHFNYEAVDYFEEGSFSIVYKAKHRVSGKISAVKKAKHPFSGMTDRTRKLNEVHHLWLVLGCGHCIQIEQSWEQNGYLYIQTEMCENGSLKNVIEFMAVSDSRFTESQIWNILRQLALGLHHIHKSGLVHLDLKPSNIFIDNLGLLKIGDFGLSVKIGQPHDLDSEGDKIYLAPEVLEGIYEQPADIFSLGLIALELAADVVLPAEGESWAALRRDEITSLDYNDCSSELISLIHSMMQPSPKKRPSADQVLTVVAMNYQHN